MSHQVDYDHRLTGARRAVFEACLVCRHVQADLESVRAITKDDRSPVTVADYASQAVVVHRLREAFGEIRMVGEEDAAALKDGTNAAVLGKVLEAVHLVWPQASEADVIDAIDAGGAANDEGHGEIFWTLDPIDGTKGFLRGGQYAVSLAWIEAGEPTLAVLGCPNLSADFQRPFDDPDPHGCIYYAYKGSGLWETSADEADKDGIHLTRLPRAEDEPARVCESVESGHTKHSDTAMIIERLGSSSEHSLRLDSQAKYAVVARGQADAYLRMPTKKGYVERIWDHAAGSLIATEAGCAVTDIHNQLLDFGHGRGLDRNKGVICATMSDHARVISAIEELGLAPAGA